MNYLDLCRELVAEFGIAGGSGPDSVSGQTGELANVVRWVRDATLDLDNRWEDWRYLWIPYTGQLDTGNIVPTPLSQPGVLPRRWQTHTLKYRTLNPLGSSWAQVPYCDFQEFDTRYDPDVATPGPPAAFTVMPDNTLKFDKPADQGYALKAGCYRMPAILTIDTDIPAVPAQYQRIIIVRAVKYYADREDAPELVRAAVTEYPDLLEKLQNAFLDARRAAGGMSQVTERATLNRGSEPAWG